MENKEILKLGFPNLVDDGIKFLEICVCLLEHPKESALDTLTYQCEM